MGTPIDLDSGHAVLNQRLVALIEQEAALFNGGLTCAIKDHQQTCCSACPIRHRDELDQMTALCNLGVEQERIITLTVIAREQPDRIPPR